ncbi:MAG: TIGR00282 family metallophosphoesterase [Planctomycetes bacterium]|nr:TIGR00282 family metallophosphoesterase [Planctomycetota bacterium]
MRILMLGDVVGKAGRKAAAELVRGLKDAGAVDFAVVNGENAAGGSGLTGNICSALLSAGVDVITSGDHVFRNKDVLEVIDGERRLLRPLNMSPAAKGRGWGVYEAANGAKVGVINAIGRLYLNVGANPYVAVEEAVGEISPETPIVVVDMHAEATSEKVAMGWFLDGKVSAVAGTHTHVMTADAKILPNGTAYITDLGMTGPHEGVIGRDAEKVLSFFYTDMPARFELAKGDVRAEGVVIDVDEASGRAAGIEAFSWVPGEELPGKAG